MTVNTKEPPDYEGVRLLELIEHYGQAEHNQDDGLALYILGLIKERIDGLQSEKEPERKWLSVEEVMPVLKDGDLIFAYSDFWGVVEATYEFEEADCDNPHRIVKKNEDAYSINYFTDIMIRKPMVLPLPPTKEVT